MSPIYEGKVCVITGAASGIGRAIARRLAGEGAILALSDVNVAGLEETKTLIGEKTNRVRTDVLDVANADAIVAYAAVVNESLGPADYVFNVAGLTRVGTFAESPLASFEKIMDVNFWGVVRMTKAFLPQLMSTRGGVVNISSLFGLIGFSGQSHYCASKFGVRGFSEALAQELAAHGVSVTSVHPGGVDTNIAKNAAYDVERNAEQRQQMVDEFKKVAGTSPERAAEIILDGAAKRKTRVLVGQDAKTISFVQRLFPMRYARLLSGVFGGRAKKMLNDNEVAAR